MAKARYTLIVSPRARRDLRKLTRRNTRLAKTFDSSLQLLASDPRPHGAEKITGSSGTLRRDPRSGDFLKQPREVDLWRIRVEGRYRIVYSILDDLVLVLIARVGDRKEVYEDIADVDV